LGATVIANLIRIIYSSQPFGFDESSLAGILLDARRCNKRDDVTGALVCRRDIYLQFLEGPEVAVQKTLERISRDDRHLDLKLRLSEPVAVRLFGDWAMLHDPKKSLIWSSAEIANGVLERATPADFKDLFQRLAETVGEDSN
jgi:hypothetical protein